MEEALSHPWIVEKVKIRALKNKLTLYSHVGTDDKKRCEDILDRIRDKFQDKSFSEQQAHKQFLPESEQKSIQTNELLLSDSSL